MRGGVPHAGCAQERETPVPLRRRSLTVLSLAAFLLAVPLLLPAGVAAQPLYREAPALSDLVMEEALPPVHERLPRTPLLVQPVEGIGRYGGSWRMGMVGTGDGLLLYRSFGYEHLVRWDPGWKRVVPNIALSFDVNATATEFTFRLRPGMRWSDGHPFTSADILFWYEDVLNHPDLAPRNRHWMMSGGRMGRVTAPDPHTVRFTFDSPNSLFLARLASAYDTKGPTDFPRHALARFHPRYNPGGIAAEMAAAGVNSVGDLFRLKSHMDHFISTPESLLRRPLPAGATVVPAERIPTLAPWVIDRWEAGRPPRFVAVRNPYFWKVDPAGSQLPYIDEAVIQQVASPEGLRDLVADGLIDMQARNIAVSVPRDSLPDVLKRGGYRSFELLSAENNTLPLGLNLTHRDPAKRALFRNRDFRIALSEGLDRKAVGELLFGAPGLPYQPAPRPESRFYHERLARQHLAHNPASANARLDAIGLGNRDSAGYRLRPDGVRAGFTIRVRRDRANLVRGATLVAEQWRALGLEVDVDATDKNALNALREEADFDMTTAATDGGIDPSIEPHGYMPQTDDSIFGIGWVHWLQKRSGKVTVPEAPPPPQAEQLALYERVLATTDPDEQTRLVRRILDIAADEFLLIGLSLPPPGYGLVRETMRNVPTFMVDSWIYPTPGPTNPFLYYFAVP